MPNKIIELFRIAQVQSGL